ncbi:MAG: hypothetical protein ACE5IC_05115 [Candidatus Brocadiales bacterium]
MKRLAPETTPSRSLKLIAVFTMFIVLTAVCICVLLFVFNKITITTFLNCGILAFVATVGILRCDPLGWYGVVIGSAVNALVFLISYCFAVKNYDVNYMYAIGFAVCVFTVGYFVRVPVQESYGLKKGPDRLEKEDFPHITKEEVM